MIEWPDFLRRARRGVLRRLVNCQWRHAKMVVKAGERVSLWETPPCQDILQNVRTHEGKDQPMNDSATRSNRFTVPLLPHEREVVNALADREHLPAATFVRRHLLQLAERHGIFLDGGAAQVSEAHGDAPAQNA